MNLSLFFAGFSEYFSLTDTILALVKQGLNISHCFSTGSPDVSLYVTLTCVGLTGTAPMNSIVEGVFPFALPCMPRRESVRMIVNIPRIAGFLILLLIGSTFCR